MKALEDLPGHQEKFWNIPPQTGNFLNMVVRSSRARKVLEIGTSNGYSGLWFAEALSHTGGKLYTVESHQERFDLARRNFEDAGVTSLVEQIFGHAPEVFSTPEFKERGLSFDLIFLDATKIEYESYLDSVLPFLKTEGLLIADNILSHRTELEGFMAYVQQKKELQFVELPLGSGLLFAFKLS